MANPTLPVVVIGSGLAGLSAAYEALSAGARVHMLERAERPGGNSIKASSGINGAPTPYQKEADSVELFTEDTVRSAGKRYNHQQHSLDRPALVHTLTSRSADAINFLTESIGVDLSTVAALGGHSAPRTHRPSSRTPPGAAIVTALLAKLKANSNFTLETSAEVTDVLVSGSAVRGVTYTAGNANVELASRAVVFATGGFANSPLLSVHRPDLASMPSTNSPSPANGHALLTALGASLVDMDAVQVHPTGFVDPATPGAGVKFLAAEALRGEGGIMLRNGKRFVNELATRKAVSEAIMGIAPTDVGGREQWDVDLLLDPGACDAAAAHIDFYVWKGLMRKLQLSELDADTLASVDEYSAAVAAGSDPLGRTKFGHWRLTPGDRASVVCVGKVTPVSHFTMGGVVVDSDARVTTASGVVTGLYAAGEVTGGLHGDNRLGGSSLLECVVFGRIAGGAAGRA